MKNLFLVIRFLTGALFVFSGLVKLNDPSGFSIKLDEYFDVFSQDLPNLDALFTALKEYSVILSGSFCALEVLLGIAMLVGWRIRFTLTTTTLLIVFFTFLTGYSAIYNKVTDCGCFGDFIHLEPWDSFKKDIILLVFVLILIGGIKFNTLLFKEKWVNFTMIISTIGTAFFGLYCYFYLPVWDFLPYKIGNNIDQIMNHIPPGERATDSVEIRFVMVKGQDSVKATTSQYLGFSENGYKFVRQDRKVIIKGYKNPIHDFAIHDLTNQIDHKDSFLKFNGYQLVFISPFLSSVNTGCLKSITELKQWFLSQSEIKTKFYALSSASTEASVEFKTKHQLNFDFFAADQKMLMTMARYNPTLYLFNGATVINKWSGNNIPGKKDIEKLIQP